LPEVGVPRSGVTKVGEVLKTTEPEPVEVTTPVPPFVTGSVPVMPVVKGKPVALVKTPEVGVPRAGVTKVGEVLRTLFPEPVDVVTPVPPLATANVPATVTTPVVAVDGVKPVEPKVIDVTAAVDGTAPQDGAPLVVAMRTCPVVPAAVIPAADVPLPYTTPFDVSVVAPVPPLTTATIPVTFSDVPPTLKPAAAPVIPVPGPEN